MRHIVSRTLLRASEHLRGARPPLAAGRFYPKDEKTLLNDIKRYISKAPKVNNPKILIVPHAGYEYSGDVAGAAYAYIGLDVTNAVIVAPAHSEFKDARIPNHTAYSTPLGDVPLMNETVGIPRGVEDDQHSIEVLLPFLQSKLPKIKILPILTGDNANPKRIADVLENILKRDDTILVVSSDLSHYNPLRKAKSIDDKTLKTIKNLDDNGPIDACGKPGIRAAMLIARRMGLKPTILDRGYSGNDSDKEVVGYASAAFSKQRESKEASSDTWKKDLMELAKESIKSSVEGSKMAFPRIPPVATKPYGVFVTITKSGELRGCIGNTDPDRPLYKAVVENARKAALEDPRFPPVSEDELDDIDVEISILSEPRKLDYKDPNELLDKITPGKDGVILSKDAKSATYLPQVWEDIPDKREFLESLSEKAGLPKDSWKTAEVKTYRVVAIK